MTSPEAVGACEGEHSRDLIRPVEPSTVTPPDSPPADLADPPADSAAADPAADLADDAPADAADNADSRAPADLPSARLRQREETRAAIARAAFRVIRRQGATCLTAEAVAAEAGVSRRTIFNHFASLDEALRPLARVWFDAFIGRLSTRPVDEPLIDSLTHLAMQPMPAESAEMLIALSVAREQSPQARTVIHGILDSWAEWFTIALRERDPHCSEVEIALLARLIPTLAESVSQVWLAGLDGPPSLADLAHHRMLTQHAVRYLRAGFRSPDPERPEPADPTAPSDPPKDT